jgi:hypothetical protein
MTKRVKKMKTSKNLPKLAIGALLLFSLSACSTKAAFVAENNFGPAKLEIEGKDIGQLPTNTGIMSTTFGQYSFSVTDDKTKLTGLLPLKVRPVRIVLDILFFAPALFFNIQGACEKYTFNMDTGITLCEDKGKQESVQVTKTAIQP